eukprot:jgi/Tetstr1/461095/TSEL_006238.t1
MFFVRLTPAIGFDAAALFAAGCPLPQVAGGSSALTHRTSKRRAVSAEASADPSGPSPGPPSPGRRLLEFLDTQFLPVGLVTFAVLAAIFPAPGAACSTAGLSKCCTFGIFLISGLLLKQADAAAALRSPIPLIFGLLTILGFTTAMGPLCLAIPFLPTGLSIGLAIFCCMPTTLSSGIALTQAVGGNTALAILLTVASNVLGIFTMPFALERVLGSTVSLQPGALLASLLKVIMLPLALGATLRVLVPSIAQAVDSNKKVTTKLQSALLITVPWMQVSASASVLMGIGLGQLLVVAAVGAGIHALFVAFNFACVRGLNMGAELGYAEAQAMQRAVVLVGSQKTLPVAVTVINSMTVWLGPAAALAVIPCIICHIMQIVVDSFLVGHWLRQDAAAQSQRKLA